MKPSVNLALVVYSVALLSFTAIAVEGRIPVYEPTVITEPGHYTVTRNISVASGNIITVRVDDVVLDLHGHTLSSSNTSGYLVFADDRYTGIEVGNGILKGGRFGVFYGSPDSRTRISLKDLKMIGQDQAAIHIYGTDFIEVTDCYITGTADGIRLYGVSDSFEGTITGNVISEVTMSGMRIKGLRSGEIIRNHIRVYGSAAAGEAGILLEGDGAYPVQAGGSIVADNTVSHSDDDFGIYISAPCNIIRGNSVHATGDTGILANMESNRIKDNSVYRCLGHGIEVTETNLVESNHCYFNTGYGVIFSNSGNGAYKNNVCYDNGSGAYYPNSNHDGGGNIP